MKLVIISASQQKHSNSKLVAQVLKNKAKAFAKVEHIELHTLNLPFYSPDIEDVSSYCANWNEINQQLNSADAFIFITPEWHGTASPMLKNFLYYLDGEHSANKPVCLVSVVAGINGAYPIAELKSNAFKNNKLVPIPDHLIIREVDQFLNEVKTGESSHSLIARVDYSLEMLYQYAQALKPVQQLARTHSSSFGQGM